MKRNFLFSIIFAVILFIIIVLRNYLFYACIFSDDTSSLFIYHGIKIITDTPYNGLYFPSSLLRIFASNIPYIMNVHPSFFQSVYFSWIGAIIFTSFISAFSILLNKKFNYLLPFYIVFLALISLYFIRFAANTLYCYDGFFRMIVPSFMFCLLFLIMFNNEQNKNRVLNIVSAILIFLCSVSNEMICIVTLIGLFLYMLICFIQNSNKETKKNIIIYALIAFLGVCLLIQSQAFVRKSGNFDMNFIWFIDVLKQLPEFTREYIKVIFINHIFEYLIFISQIIFLMIKYPLDKSKNETIKLCCCFLIGILLFFFLLIGLGKTHFYGGYWINHGDLHMIYSLIFCSFNLALFSIIINKEQIKNYIIMILFTIFIVFLAYEDYIFYTMCKNDFDNLIRKEVYKAEKIIRIANIHNKTAYIDQDITNNTSLWSFYDYGIPSSQIITKSSYLLYLNQFPHSKINIGYVFTDKETVDKEFKANGGTFSEEELVEPNFNNLLDDNFLLNKKLNKK